MFFEGGAIGYSPSGNKFDGLKLKTFNWKVEPLNVSAVQSSFFENEYIFPKGSVKFDNALLMTQIKHEWHSVGQKSHCLQHGVWQKTGWQNLASTFVWLLYCNYRLDIINLQH